MASCLIVGKHYASRLLIEHASATKVLNTHDLSPSPFDKLLAIISFGDPGETWPDMLKIIHNRGDTEVLRLEFKDIDNSKPFDNKGYNGPKQDHVDSIIETGSKYIKEDGTILIHCYAGVSRSTAAAYILYASKYGPDNLDYAFQKMKEGSICKYPWPNREMLQLASNTLGFDIVQASIENHKQLISLGRLSVK